MPHSATSKLSAAVLQAVHKDQQAVALLLNKEISDSVYSNGGLLLSMTLDLLSLSVCRISVMR